jgi:hypothetical protein
VIRLDRCLAKLAVEDKRVPLLVQLPGICQARNKKSAISRNKMSTFSQLKCPL